VTSPGRRPLCPLTLPTNLKSLSEEETRAIGEALGRGLGPGDVVALVGPLGAGKTCFAAGLARGLGSPASVISPTFALVREYSGRFPIRHVDLYRLDPADIQDLDWRDLFYGPGVALVEWAERAADYLPSRTYRVTIDLDPSGNPGHRVISIAPPAEGSVDPPTPSVQDSSPSGRETAGPRSYLVSLAPAEVAIGPTPGLAIDTSTGSRSLAVLAGDEVRELFWLPPGDVLPAEDLSAHLAHLLDAAGLRPSDLKMIAVSLGPGSFTGVKVGLAAAKSLAYALQCPLAGVPTLDVLAAGAFRALEGNDANDPDRPDDPRPAVISLIDARRGEVYGAAYVTPAEPVSLPEWEEGPYLSGLTADVLEALAAALTGSGWPGLALVAGDVTVAALQSDPNGSFLSRGRQVRSAGPEGRHPRASDLLRLARARLRDGAGNDPLALQPLYLRAPQLGRPVHRGGGRP
jgi:tRNA threonylcarbamoyladenosine biosynthesis protein TsaE